MFYVLKSGIFVNYSGGGAIAQWIRPPTLSSLYSEILYYICRYIEERTQDKKREARVGPYFKRVHRCTRCRHWLLLRLIKKFFSWLPLP